MFSSVNPVRSNPEASNAARASSMVMVVASTSALTKAAKSASLRSPVKELRSIPDKL